MSRNPPRSSLVAPRASPDRDGVEHELRHSLSLLQATLESTTDGLLIVDLAGGIVRFNPRFVELWGLPDEVLATEDDEAALAEAAALVRDPEHFLETVRELYRQPEATAVDVIELLDGRIVERHSRPQRLGGEVVGRVWSFRDITEQNATEVALRESEARYRRLFEESRQATYLTTREGELVDANPAALRLFGYGPDELGELAVAETYVDREERDAFIRAIEGSGSVEAYPVRLRHRDGHEMECLLSSTVRLGVDGEVLGYQGIVEDVTERVRTERALRESELKFRSLIENASDTITVLGASGEIIYESPSVQRVLGHAPEDLIGRSVFDFTHPEDQPAAVRNLERLLADEDHVTRLELRFAHGDGSWRILEVVARNLLSDPAIGGIVVNARDVTERKEAEARLLHDAFHDRLTQLPNRARLLDRMAQLLRRTGRNPERTFSVLFLDLDRFKVINDSLSHMVGDQLLVAIGRRLEGVLRPGDTVARLGGDEFTMLLDDADREEACRIADRIQTELQAPFTVGRHEIYVTVSIGITTSRDGGRSPEDMLRDADLAMYCAKDRGRARFERFDPEMRTAAVAQLELETDLRRALEREEFSVHLQPIVQLDRGRLFGFEALLRWNHPGRGLLLPNDFLQLAEDTGLIVPIGGWVMRKVCEGLREWADEFGASAPPVQVNLAAQQIVRVDFLEQVRCALADSRAPAHLLHLELTEGTMMENAESTVATLNALKALGIGLSIDDFGTGYSSLSYLHRFPTDSVKIDRSFVAQMGPQARNSRMVRTIVDLAHDLGMRVVAEGVETEVQASTLRGMRCEYGQGFLFSRAVPFEEATALIREGRIW